MDRAIDRQDRGFCGGGCAAELNADRADVEKPSREGVQWMRKMLVSRHSEVKIAAPKRRTPRRSSTGPNAWSEKRLLLGLMSSMPSPKRLYGIGSTEGEYSARVAPLLRTSRKPRRHLVNKSAKTPKRRKRGALRTAPPRTTHSFAADAANANAVNATTPTPTRGSLGTGAERHRRKGVRTRAIKRHPLIVA